MRTATRFLRHGCRKTWMVGAGLLVSGLTAVAAFACSGLTGNIFGTPGTYGCNASYQVTVSENTVSPCVTGLANSHRATSATGPWVWKYQFTFSGGSTFAQHTWTLANQDNNSYWWRGEVVDSGSTTAWTSAKGPFTTTTCC